jgi:CxxC motif-containing protein (DUF1111 family)/beta-glucanase (GH16 family)
MKILIKKRTNLKHFIWPVLAGIFIVKASADVGELIWEDNFDSLNAQVWNIDTGDGCAQGICGWGNQELQWYAENNASIEPVAGESGNNALVLEARDEVVGDKVFTSGKVQSSNKISVQYGMIEVRMQVPEIEVGLWPAAWMLGTSTASWPSKGEIDMMEMGQSATARSDAGFPDALPNHYVGSNLIFYTELACSDGNPSCAASTAWQTDNAYVSDSPLSNRFVIYRTYWTDTEIRFTIEDNGIETDLYDSPFLISDESDEFKAPFYLLFNLAVGGNFTDALSSTQVTAPRPGKMLIDYIRVYQLDGQGTVFTGNVLPAETGNFGVYSDADNLTNQLEAGTSSDIYNWNQDSVSDGSIAPYEGDNVIAWHYENPNQWFGGGIQTRQARDMSNFVDGDMTFKIKIPADVSFKIGISDTYSNENWIDFPAFETTHGLVRNGDWSEATIPIADLRGELIALQSIKAHFNIASIDGQLPTDSFQFAIDDIVWSGGGDPVIVDTDGDGVIDELDLCSDTPIGTQVDADGCPVIQDGDSDGVIDADDLCPNTPEGAEVDSDGCEIPRVENLTIQAEDYLNYFDTSVGNNGGAYRFDDVDIEATTDIDAGYNVGWTASGEWLEYEFSSSTGSYEISTRVSSAVGNASYTLLLNGSVIATDDVNNTGSWQTFETHSIGEVSLTAGSHLLRIEIIGGEFNLNWINLVLVSATDSDNDGVNDDVDQCPNTPAGTDVDDVGCAIDIAVDSDNDGVNDDIDQCPNTPAGTAVDDVGCAIDSVVDSDNDGVNDDIDQCPNTPTGTEVDSVGCAIISSTTGIEQDSDSSVTFYVNSSAWADVHYILNSNGQQNFRMTFSADRNTKTLTGLSTGDEITYWFTYLTANNEVIDTTQQVYTMGVAIQPDEDGDGVADSIDQCPGTPSGSVVDVFGCTLVVDPDPDPDPNPEPEPGIDVVPLYDENTLLEAVTQFDRGDALVTRFSDRGRDRHAREDQFQGYDHYLSFYWEHRTAAIEIVDFVAKGGDTITFNVVTQWPLNPGEAELRFWYEGRGTVAQYYDNGVMSQTTDNLHYTRSVSTYRAGRDPSGRDHIQIGDRMEFELSQFLDHNVPRGRSAYYGTTYLYIVGEGLVPWKALGSFEDQNSEREDSYPIAIEGRLGGETTLSYQYTAEPDDHFMQMATNLGYDNGQPFVLGRRIHHTNFVNGKHDESIDNGTFDEMIGKAGTHYVNARCAGCHERNGRASPEAEGVALDKWVFKVGDANGNPDPNIGRVLQPNNVGIDNETAGEGNVSIAFWTEVDGLRSPSYQFDRTTPAKFSARIAPQLVGLGLLEAIPEASVLALEDTSDSNNDGISGKAQRAIDPMTGETRLGRFGWKAATTHLKHQIAAAFNTDMGVMTSVLPEPDCGTEQMDCGASGSELSDEHLDNLVKYIALLGVSAQRDLDDPKVQQGQTLFTEIGCESCHTATHQTSAFYPFAELRDQTIHPYTDLLLHDMGEGLADSLGEGQATGAEWRTTPLWGIGLSACVTGGVINPQGGQGNEVCSPEHSYLHDGRARTIEEAILWHGGEAETSKLNYQALSAASKSDVLSFLNSL